MNPSVDTQKIQHTVLFDADCGFCQQSVDRLKRWGADQYASFLPNTHDETVLAGTGLTRSHLGKAIVLVSRYADGQLASVHVGAACVNTLLWNLPGWRYWYWRLLSRLYCIPGLRWIEDQVYGWVSRNRHRFVKNSTCALPID